MRSFFMSVVAAGCVAAIEFGTISPTYNVGPAIIGLDGPGYVSALTLWQSPSHGVNVFIEDIVPQASCNQNHICLLYPKNDSLIFNGTLYPDGNKYFLSLDWSSVQYSNMKDIKKAWSTHFSINAKGIPNQPMELRNEKLQATAATSNVPVSSSTSPSLTASISTSATAQGIMATGQTFAAINPITIEVVLYEQVAENNLAEISTNSTATANESTTAVGIATQSVDGLLRAPISANTSEVLTVSTTSQMALASLVTATASPTTSAKATGSAVAEELSAANILKLNSMVSIGMVILFGLLHLLA